MGNTPHGDRALSKNANNRVFSIKANNSTSKVKI